MPLTRIVEFIRLFAQLEIARKEPGYGQALEAKYCGFLEVVWETMTFEEQEAIEYVLRSDLPLLKTKVWKAEHPCTIVKSVSMGCMVGNDVCQLCEDGPAGDLHAHHSKKLRSEFEPTAFSEFDHLLDGPPADAS